MFYFIAVLFLLVCVLLIATEWTIIVVVVVAAVVVVVGGGGGGGGRVWVLSLLLLFLWLLLLLILLSLDIQVPVGTPDRALRTVPEGIFEVRPSSIPRAGMGAFTSTFIPRHTWLGEYEGEFLETRGRFRSAYRFLVL